MKLEQIAIATNNPRKTMDFLNAIFSLSTWSQDTVIANAMVFGAEPEDNKAQLNFNYELGVELEVLEYQEGNNWHKARVAAGATFPFLSHIGYHCTEEEAQLQIELMRAIGVGIAQEVFTTSHTNEVIAGKRLYHYIVFDSAHAIGFDLKLIVRRDAE